MTAKTVAGFLPSTSGLHFANAFPKVPVRKIGIPGIVSVPIGDASNGLCGGMVFAARDYFEQGRPPPSNTTPPSRGKLFDYIVTRLFDSFDLPFGPGRYLGLMNPMLPDDESVWSRIGLAPHGRAWRMVHQEWPKVRADIEAGHPSPLGLVRIKSADPFQLKRNHQVLAYGYEHIGSLLTLRVYDPNRPGDDDVAIGLDLEHTTVPIAATPPVFAFFRVTYAAAAPP